MKKNKYELGITLPLLVATENAGWTVPANSPALLTTIRIAKDTLKRYGNKGEALPNIEVGDEVYEFDVFSPCKFPMKITCLKNEIGNHLDITKINGPMKDKLGVFLYPGMAVLMPDPLPEDTYSHEFIGTVHTFCGDCVTVIDQDTNGHDMEPNYLEVLRNYEF